MKRSDKKGVILGIVLIYMLVMTILGYGLLHLSYANSMQTDNYVRSTRAFWLAEAGIQRSISLLPTAGAGTWSETIDTGRYDVTGSLVSGFLHRYTIDSIGQAGIGNPRIRHIRVISAPDMGAINANGDTEINGTPNIGGDVNEYCNYTFEGVFGRTKANVMAGATHYYDNTDADNTNDYSNNQTPVSGITWVNGDFKVTNNFWIGSGLLVVNGQFEMQGGNFTGIIWAISARISGNNTTMNGALFSESETVVLRIAGDPNLNYDAAAIDSVIDITNPAAPLGIVSWGEVPN